MMHTQEINDRYPTAFLLAIGMALVLMLAISCVEAACVEKAYADSYADTHQTAPMPDHVIMPKELRGKWSPNAEDDEAIYIEFRYDKGDLVYFFYKMAYNPIGTGSLKSRLGEFEFNHGFVALQGNQGTCNCYTTNGKKVYESFYVDSASEGYIIEQDSGEKYYKVGKPGKWRTWLSWPTKPDCYDATTGATANGKTSLGPGAEGNAASDKVKVTNLRATNISSTDALLSATAYKEPGVDVKNCGIYMGLSEATMQRVNVEAVPDVSNRYHNGKDFDIWYDLTDELGVYLEPHTKYYYRFYCEVGNEVYLSDVATFTTD